jgi:hypothetical protein
MHMNIYVFFQNLNILCIFWSLETLVPRYDVYTYQVIPNDTCNVLKYGIESMYKFLSFRKHKGWNFLSPMDLQFYRTC